MDKYMLINAVHSEECRIAIVEDKKLVELEVESNTGRTTKGNIYRAKISRIEPSLQAAFVDLGSRRNGFLQINDIHPAYFKNWNPPPGRRARPRIQDVLEPGQELVVQIVKEERDLKGATLTTHLSLPGRYIVLMPGSDKGGISRKISDEDQRQRLKKLSQELEIPTGMGIIVRTAGLDRSLSELSRDLTIQLKLWEEILMSAQGCKCPTLLYEDNHLPTRVMRDYFTPDIREVLIDEPKTFEQVREFVSKVMPRYRSRIRFYQDEAPLFSTFNIDAQVETTLMPEVKLPSGGAIVIEQLEALVAIDVNSGKATQGGSIEDTAFQTNLEAAEEVSRQLRLRDLGGLIVVDFIDMLDKRHRMSLERRISEVVSGDKARVELGHLSKFGLFEMSRQRLRAPLATQSHQNCPTCAGRGQVKDPNLVALEALRKVQAAVIVGGVDVAKVRLHPNAALILLNNKRSEISKLEQEKDVTILVLADGRLRPDEVQFEMETAPRDEGSTLQRAPVKAAIGGADEEDSAQKDSAQKPSPAPKKIAEA
jgi:ribonuclease E